MLNWLWFGMLAAGFLCGAAGGRMEQVTAAALDSAGEAVGLIVDMCGLLCLWLGVLRIAEASGLVQKMGRLLSPVVGLLFPELPPSHPAFASIVMNFSANLLGLGNAATPFGLKAMSQLQQLNREPDRATASMITLLALNTSGVTLIPTMMISLRLACGSRDPSCIIVPTALASGIGLIFALILDALLRRRQQGR
ncbi:MAG: spore maturation protein [Firmicutes bacterium]|nr:spore maturation protein [Bacillota bacterium]